MIIFKNDLKLQFQYIINGYLHACFGVIIKMEALISLKMGFNTIIFLNRQTCPSVLVTDNMLGIKNAQQIEFFYHSCFISKHSKTPEFQFIKPQFYK